MKAIIFTLDSIFALVIATASISILLYFNNASHISYSIQYSEAKSIMNVLLSTSVGQLQNSSPLAAEITNQSLGSNETWPQFAGNANRQSSNPYAPSKPFVSFVFNAGNVLTTSIVADYGNIYFATGNFLYAVNATQNRQVWRSSASISLTPALYNGMLIYFDTTTGNLVAVSARTGSFVWSTTLSGSMTTSLTIYNNEVIFGENDNSLHAFYAINGTQAWSVSTVTYPISIATSQGSIAVENSTGAIAVIVSSGNSAVELWGAPQTPIPTSIATQGPVIYFGSGANANALYINGTPVTGFPVSLSSGGSASSVSPAGSSVVYQTAQGVSSVSQSGSQLWSIAVPSNSGVAVASATPVVSNNNVYTLWSNGMVMQNLSTGSISWFTRIPYASPSYMTLAYGRIYVVAGSRVIAYGSCGARQGASLLESAANMYVNYFGGCADAMLSSARTLNNYSIFIGNSFGPSMHVADFDGQTSYISAQNNGAMNTSLVSVSFWINISSYPQSLIKIVNYADASTYAGWFFDLTNNVIEFNIMNGATQSTVTSNALNPPATNKWFEVTGTFDGGYMKLYINGALVQSKVVSGSIMPPPPSIGLNIGGIPGVSIFNGRIANLQIYALPLSTSQVAKIYQGGIQSAPLADSKSVAWYPLQGDANDYSDYSNAGYAVGVSYGEGGYVPVSLGNAYEISKAGVPAYISNYTTGSTYLQNIGVYAWR